MSSEASPQTESDFDIRISIPYRLISTQERDSHFSILSYVDSEFYIKSSIFLAMITSPTSSL